MTLGVTGGKKKQFKFDIVHKAFIKVIEPTH